MSMDMMRSQGRSPTFFVGGERQRYLLHNFHRSEQQLSEDYQKYRPLCFNAGAYQKTHPAKVKAGHKDADRTSIAPMILGVADGVSQIESFGIDASQLPEELLDIVTERAMAGLIPGIAADDDERYSGPIPLLREAFEATESLGSTTVVLAIMDNINTQIHGKLHPMVAVITIGDCELLMLRRRRGRSEPLEAIFHTEMQRIDGHAQQPLQLARVDGRIDPDFDESITIEVIERGSAVHCISAYEGDILVLGSDGVFDNLFLDEIVDVCNQMMPARDPSLNVASFAPLSQAVLDVTAQKLVAFCHSKTSKDGKGKDTPIGQGGKMDDTSVVVAEVVQWTESMENSWSPGRKRWGIDKMFACGGSGCAGADMYDEKGSYSEDDMSPVALRKTPQGSSNIERQTSEYEEEGSGCSIV